MNHIIFTKKMNSSLLTFCCINKKEKTRLAWLCPRAEIERIMAQGQTGHKLTRASQQISGEWLCVL
jgi:hypothetical protein